MRNLCAGALFLSMCAHACGAELQLQTPTGETLSLPADADAAAVKAWAKRAGVPNPGKFVHAYAARSPGSQYRGYAFVSEPEAACDPPVFWRGLLFAIAAASAPPALQEVRQTGRPSSITVGLLLVVPLAVLMGAWSAGVYWFESQQQLGASTSWVPSAQAFGAIFVLWAAVLAWLSVVAEIKAGALCMVLGAWAYFYTDARCLMQAA